jgi:hypothetical protein
MAIEDKMFEQGVIGPPSEAIKDLEKEEDASAGNDRRACY